MRTRPISQGRYHAHLRREAGLPARGNDEPALFLGKCLGWDMDGPAVLRHYRPFVGWQPPERAQYKPPSG